MFLCVSVSVAQQITGSITGTVTDPPERPSRESPVKLTNSGTGVVQSATTTQSGDFRFLLLPSGIYSLDATRGFKTLPPAKGSSSKWTVPIAVPVEAPVGPGQRHGGSVGGATAARSEYLFARHGHGRKKVSTCR